MTENRKEQKMSTDKRTALKVTKKAISQYLECEEGLRDDCQYFIYVKDNTYSSEDMLNMSLTQRKSLVSKAEFNDICEDVEAVERAEEEEQE